MSQSPAPNDELEFLAAEYALGALEGPARAEAEALLKSSPAFAARVAEWSLRLAPMAEDVAAVPAPNLLPKIEARLFGARSPKWFSLPKGWFTGLLGTGAMAALSVIVFALTLQFGDTGQNGLSVQTAVLTAKGSAFQVLARLEGDNLTLSQQGGAGPAAGRSFEVWLIDGDKPPLSLGLLDGALTISAPDAALGYVLAITDEPFGGGPGGKPTGEVIAAGSFGES